MPRFGIQKILTLAMRLEPNKFRLGLEEATKGHVGHKLQGNLRRSPLQGC